MKKILYLVTHVCGAIATLCEGEILQNDKANRQEMRFPHRHYRYMR